MERSLTTLGELEFTLIGAARNLELIKKEASNLTPHPLQAETDQERPACVYCLIAEAQALIEKAARETLHLRNESMKTS